MYKTYKCGMDNTTKLIRATSEEHAALLMAHWYQVEHGTELKQQTLVLVAGIGYNVQSPSGFVEKV